MIDSHTHLHLCQAPAAELIADADQANSIIAAGAVTLLASGAPRIVFLLAGLGVETIGLVLFARSHPLLRGESD